MATTESVNQWHLGTSAKLASGMNNLGARRRRDATQCCLSLTIVLASLFTLATVASSPVGEQQPRLVKPVIRLHEPSLARQSVPIGTEPDTLDADEVRALEALERIDRPAFHSADSSKNNRNSLAIRQSQPTFGSIISEPELIDLNVDSAVDDNDDENFLRQLKVAGDYLKEQLAAGHEREHQLELQAASSSRLNDDESPRYALESAPVEVDAPLARDRLLAGGQGRTNFHSKPQLADSEDDLSDSQLASQSQPADDTDAKNLFKYLMLLDEAQSVEQQQQQHQPQSRSQLTAPAAHEDKRHAHHTGDEGDEENDDNSEQVATGAPVVRQEQPPIKYTTLLEDEEVRGADRNATPSAPPTDSYGQPIEQKANSTTNSGATSMFSGLYGSLASYLPFLNQLNILHASSAGSTTDSSRTAVVADSKATATASTSAVEAKDKEHDKMGQSVSAAKHRFSLTLSKKQTQSAGAQGENHGDAEGDKSERFGGQFDGKAVEGEEAEGKKRVKVGVKSKADADEDDFAGQIDAKSLVRASSNSKRLSVSLTPAEELELARMIPVEQHSSTDAAKGNNGFNLIRQSNLMLPLSSPSEDELQGQEARDSLLGRYIYAPTQHYYLNAIPAAGHQPHPTTSGAHFESLKPAYSFGREPSNWVHAGSSGGGDNSKPNDLYFLVMVGAFCAMAMAVALAAGAFAYRVQQQRKSCQETDYPTYGVVGPNNMTGKCGGAAAFVGGYFGSAGGPPMSGAYAAGGKHLAEMYASGLDSGMVSSIDKCSSGSSACSAAAAHKQRHSAASQSSSPSSGGGQQAVGNQDTARMYHYQHQKQQMIISDGSFGKRHTSASDLDEDEENDDGSYTVYECPGLASAHEMEIKNPLFNDDHSP